MWIRTYKNGDVGVIIKGDGTKIRVAEGPPELPESIDLKITDYCDAGCSYCHESSTTRGKHADTDFIIEIIDQMIPGTELAIGGGNPLSHPDLNEILRYAAANDIIPNLTINEKHLDEAIEKKVYYWEGGIGISISTNPNIDKIKKLTRQKDHIVFHLIHMVHNKALCYLLAKKFELPKILILGYKNFGFGVKHGKDIDLNSYHANQLSCGSAFKNEFLRRATNISFDNLALEQLKVKEYATDPEYGFMSLDEWNKRYMGDDGSYTMYIDAVKEQYAVSSTSPRKAWGDGLREAFEDIRYGKS